MYIRPYDQDQGVGAHHDQRKLTPNAAAVGIKKMSPNTIRKSRLRGTCRTKRRTAA
ncbi:MAG: hypothetical protein WBA12_11445 [Catalinimonas sp.]